MEVICNYAQSSVAQEQDDGVNAKDDDGVKRRYERRLHLECIKFQFLKKKKGARFTVMEFWRLIRLMSHFENTSSSLNCALHESMSFSCWTLEIIDGDSRHYRWFIAELSEIWDEEARGRRRREGDATTRQLMVVSVVHVNEGNDIVVLATISWRWRLHLPLLICHQISQKISNSTALCMRWKTKIMCGIDNLSSAQMRMLTKIKRKGIDHRVFGRLT